MVLVKTAVYHAMGTLMPYPSEDPPQKLGLTRLFNGCLISVLKLFSYKKVGGIHSISW
jgi:hypothetical protein